jgi:hypothetical protein
VIKYIPPVLLASIEVMATKFFDHKLPGTSIYTVTSYVHSIFSQDFLILLLIVSSNQTVVVFLEESEVRS